MNAALVTGAHGFLGAHIVASLKLQYNVSTLGVNPGNDYVVDLSKEIPALNSNFMLVVHAAGIAHKKQVPDEAMFNVNVEGTKNLCAAFDNKKQYPKHFVFISTVAVYGLVEGENIAEDALLQGSSAYAKSKIAAETVVAAWCQKNHVVCTILRLPLVAGKNAPGNIFSMKQAIAANRFFIPGKGNAKKSVVLASDVAAVIPIAAQIGGTYHLTDGEHPTLKAFALSLGAFAGKKKLLFVPMWLCEILASIGNLAGSRFPFNSAILKQLTSTLTFSDQRAKKALGWKAHAITTFNDW